MQPSAIHPVLSLSPPGSPQQTVWHSLQKRHHFVAVLVDHAARNRHPQTAHNPARLTHHDGRRRSALLRSGHGQFMVSPDKFVSRIPLGPRPGNLTRDHHFRPVGQFFKRHAGHAGSKSRKRNESAERKYAHRTDKGKHKLNHDYPTNVARQIPGRPCYFQTET